MKNNGIKKRGLKLIKKGIQHIDINYSLDIKQAGKEAREFMKNKKLTEKDIYEILRKKVRIGISNKWNGANKWHKECNKILPLLHSSQYEYKIISKQLAGKTIFDRDLPPGVINPFEIN